MPPRLFWRRALAFVLDAILATVAAVLLTLPLVFLAPDRVEIGSLPLSRTSCAPSPEIMSQDLAPGASATELCEHTNLITGRVTYSAISHITRSHERDGGMHTTYKIVTQLDTNGTPVSRIALDQTLAPLVLLLGSLASLTRLGTTPGKAVAGLEISGQGCLPCRELRRVGPWLLVAIAGLALVPARESGLLDPTSLNRSQLVLVTLCGLLLIIWYYLWPLIRWTGAHRWDQSTGFSVTRRL